ncbi:phosphohistidine phosphatase SixA [Acinetobacter shaoyimingii]|uniref:Phosphohistidine phosphatase SixA n=1 Tax=Acinetobacter shaoyimingii TaxID=2715164 RepID=A0A6G8RX41_9GAMM|nr:phosphohistidine phosphatase SixA [Acinetobacter shaoyimingii]QIO06293.1 phosphohistidine phosphatase SixA [Acinetobacter shaoyimingii]
MQLTLVRHGEASPAYDGNDSKRQLTVRGHQQAEQTAAYLKEQVQPDIFIVSPLVRAQETLAHIQRHFPNVTTLICDKIKPDDDAKDAIEWLSQLPFENIVVVCHMNVVAHIAEQLAHEHFHAFSLAEARIYEQSVIANGLSTQQKAFVPTR